MYTRKHILFQAFYDLNTTFFFVENFTWFKLNFACCEVINDVNNQSNKTSIKLLLEIAFTVAIYAA